MLKLSVSRLSMSVLAAYHVLL